MDKASGLCVGCARTLDEIAYWSALDDDAKRAIWAQLRERALHLPPASPAATAELIPPSAP